MKKFLTENRTQIIMVVGAAFAGIIFGATAYSPKGVPAQTKTVTREVCRNEETWKELKAVDDRGFYLAGQAMGTSVGFIEAAEHNDPVAMKGLLEQMATVTDELETTSDQRRELLAKLGY